MVQKTSSPPVYHPYVEEEVDLRVYINMVLRRWRLIIAAIVLTALGAGLASMVQGLSRVPQYETAALVATDKVGLATSDSLLQQVQSSSAPNVAVAQLREMVSASNIDNTPPLVELKVQSPDPQQAAEIANRWADLFVVTINDLNPPASNDEEVEEVEEVLALTLTLTQQLEQAKADVEAAEQAQIAFESQNKISMLQAKLDSMKASYTYILNEPQQIEQITLDIERFRTLLGALPSNAPVALSDELTAIFFELKVFNAQGSTGLLQISDPELLSDKTKTASEIVTLLDQLVATLQEKSEQINAPLAQLEAEILELQGRIQALKIEQNHFNKNLEMVQNAYTTLETQVEEAEAPKAPKAPKALEASTGPSQAKVVSEATVPQNPIPVTSNTLRNILLAAVVGLMIGLGAAFLIEYMREEPAEGKHVTQE